MATDSILSFFVGGSGGGGSARITANAAESIGIGNGVSIDTSGEFEKYTGIKPLFGLSEFAVTTGQGLTVTSTKQFAGTVVNYPSALDLNQTVNVPGLGSGAYESGNTGALGGSGIHLSDDRKLFFKLASNTLSSYGLSTANDLTSSTAGATFSLSGDDTQMNSFCFTADRKGFYAFGDVNDKIFQYSMPNRYGIGSATKIGEVTVDTGITSISVSPNGKHLATLNDGTELIKFYDLTDGDIGTAVLATSRTIAAGQYKDIILTDDPNSLFLVVQNTDRIEKLSMTNYDASTINTTPVASLTVTTETSFPECAWIADSGDRIVIADSTNAYMYTATADSSSVTIDPGQYIYTNYSGGLTASNTGTANFVGFKTKSTQIIMCDAPA